MPVIAHSTYTPPLLFKNHHLQTIYPTLFRKVPGVRYVRERIATPDDDFLDLDWSRVGGDRLLLAIHGLEGSAQSNYMLGVMRAFNWRGWDGVAMNLRGCSGEMNRQLRFYHAGATDDVHTVVTHLLRPQQYRRLAIVGFSIGANLALKYVGERGAALAPEITRAVGVSAPCDLAACAWKLAEPSNVLYMRRFLRKFHRKIAAKMQTWPDRLDDANFSALKTFKDYDDRYTAPLHGFASAEDYWRQTSCQAYLSGVRIPTLVLNARDDPFLTPACFPVNEAETNPALFLEIPTFGGHTGFVTFRADREYWHETRVAGFILDDQ